MIYNSEPVKFLPAISNTYEMLSNETHIYSLTLNEGSKIAFTANHLPTSIFGFNYSLHLWISREPNGISEKWRAIKDFISLGQEPSDFLIEDYSNKPDINQINPYVFALMPGTYFLNIKNTTNYFNSYGIMFHTL